MPSHYVEPDREEMAYVDGGFSWSTFWSWTAAVAAVVTTVIVVIVDPEPISKLATVAKCCELVAAAAGVGALLTSD